MQKKITNIIINDINDMLNDIGQDEFTSDKKGLTGTGAIRKELEKYVDITYNINLIKIWGAVISQYVPKIKYVVKYNPQLVDSIGIEHNSIITEIQNKLENGQNINSEKDKILPSFKYPYLSLLREQSNVIHIHLASNGIRKNCIIFAKIDIYNNAITFEKISTHEEMRHDYVNNEYMSRELVFTGVKGVGINSKNAEYQLRKKGINTTRDGIDGNASTHISFDLYMMYLNIYMTRNINFYDDPMKFCIDYKIKLVDYFYNFKKIFPKEQGF